MGPHRLLGRAEALAWNGSRFPKLGQRLRYTGGSMTRNPFSTLRHRLFACMALIAAATIAPAQTPAAAPVRAVTPVDRLRETWWANRHNALLEQIKRNPNAGLLLLGDSITQNYEKGAPPDENFQSTWQRFYAPRAALNAGFSGDRTEHVLWRLDHGEVDGIRPRAVVLLIGTNNTAAGQSAADVELGIDAIVVKLRQKLPQSSILVVGILPSDISEAKSAADREINQYLARRYTVDPKVTYLDIGPVFFQDGKLNASIFYDPRLPRPGKPLHPDTVGQRLMAEAIEPTLTRILQDGARQYLASLVDVNTATIPVPRLEMDSYDWYERHKDVLSAKSQVDPEVVLIGDSITHFWAGLPKSNRISGAISWELAFGGMRALNLGFGWDRTQNVLWRLAHGEFDGLRPKTVVLNIGTNNLTGTANARANTPAEVVQGILAIVDTVRSQSPESRIIVMGVFPRGFGASTAMRAAIRQVNQLLAPALAGKEKTSFLDIGDQFLEPDGTLPKSLMADGTHPTEEGYKIWAKALIEAGVRRR
jgi:lysophospholipase L1-like esterase